MSLGWGGLSTRDAKLAHGSLAGDVACLIVGSEGQARGLPYPIPCGFLGAEVPIAWALQKNFSSSLKVSGYSSDVFGVMENLSAYLDYRISRVLARLSVLSRNV